MKRVAIATPSYDGKVNVEYANSLAQSISFLKSQNYSVDYFSYHGEAIIQSARNKLLSMMYPKQYDSIVWIDSDISWNPKDLFSLFESKEDVIGATYRLKKDKESYVFKSSKPVQRGLLSEVDALGFGFIKLSSKAILNLWESSETYTDDDMQCKNVFEVIVKDSQMYSEDVVVCEKLKKLGFKIYLDKTINLTHFGQTQYEGNFNDNAI
jgi:hypothetical protein